MLHGSDYHVPVLVEEVLTHLVPEHGGIHLDGTLGGGGHSEAILTHSAAARVIGVDRDPEAIAAATARLARFGDRFRAVPANFADAVDAAGVAPGTLDGVLLDLGISSHQIDETARGFSFRTGAPLDMRMAGGARGERTAAEVLNEDDEEELARIFYRYGEEKRSRRLARVVAERRATRPFATSDDLIDAMRAALGPRDTVQDRARIFQALRIAVNGEMEALEQALPAFRDALRPGGTLVVIAYHSLEDRIVKNAFRDWTDPCRCPPGFPVCGCGAVPFGAGVTRKAVPAGPAEVAANPRARSAHLRAWRRA